MRCLSLSPHMDQSEKKKKAGPEAALTLTGDNCCDAVVFESDDRKHPPKHPPITCHKLGISSFFFYFFVESAK